MKHNYRIAKPNEIVWLRSAQATDLENLRTWKNAHRERFFHQDEITPEQQVEWFEQYQQRETDLMWIVMVADKAIGCMGFRWISHSWDIYNVISADPEYQGKGWMAKALRTMEAYATRIMPETIMARVLRNNQPALSWYRNQGYFSAEAYDIYFVLAHSDTKKLLQEAKKLEVDLT